ncbi:MAG: hypothetical protein LBP31_01470, partial [Holosporales bacterium]|jgi:glycyl-tRNA synthetase beta subunit|nr:hypothetical protein [Holosporales bacterium]
LIEFNNKYANDLKDFLITVSMSDSLEEDLEKAVKLSELVLDVCENIMILDENKDIRENNVKLLSEFVEMINASIGEIYDVYGPGVK